MEKQVQAFLDHLIAHKRYSANTIAAYRNDLTQFLAYLDSPDLLLPPQDWSEVTTPYLTGYFLSLKERAYTPSTQARKIAAVKSFFEFLAATHVIDANPATALSSPKVKRPLPKTISPEQVEQLLAEPARDHTPRGVRDWTLMLLLYATGMRVTELVSLDVMDVDLTVGTVRCGSAGENERLIPIDQDVAEALRLYLKESRPRLVASGEERALFVNHRGQRLTRQGLWLIIKYYVRAVGIEHEVTPHTLRHSFAAHMLDRGATLHEVQRLLGHANLSTTQVYAELSQQPS